MKYIFPPKLKKGDEIRVIAPARSLSLLSEESLKQATENLEKQGFKVTFSKNCREHNMFMSSSIKSRLDDIHQAFKDENVKAILTVIGGYNSNELLPYLDYELIRSNPKILCGYSDITALANAITAKTGLVTYSGLHFSTWAMEKGFEYNLEYFNKCLLSNDSFEVKASDNWSDDPWWRDQKNRNFEKNNGYVVINSGKAEGTILGGNICTFNLIQGTEFMPDLTDAVLFIEDDAIVGGASDVIFNRDLQSLIQQPNFDKVKGIVIGRFQKESEMTVEKIKFIIETKKELKSIPVIANADFGHTNPLITFPIGGRVRISAIGSEANIEILTH